MKKFLDRFSELNIAVLGDVMLDIFTYGISERLSPEAPIPVVRIVKKDHCPGGAGNVAVNLVSLDVKSSLFGVIGDDSSGEKLISNLQNAEISSGLIKDSMRRTTVKERFIANQQQMLRVDEENTDAIPAELQNAFADKICRLIAEEKIQAVIFSDYHKGVISSELIQKITDCANEHSVITALDPKPGLAGTIRNLTLLKPNRSETFTLAGMKDDLFADAETQKALLIKAAEKVYEKFAPRHLVISLSADGLTIYENGKISIIPTHAKEVFDVSGAGDTLIASMTAALAAGADITTAAAIGNIAAGIAVGKRGTSCVSREEIISNL